MMHTMKPHPEIPATRNEAWGFWATMRGDAAIAWPVAIAAIVEAIGESPEDTRTFLDSRNGRHFADDVQIGLHAGQCLKHAVRSATARWMGWTISRRTGREYGIPSGLPYLTGFVIHAAINDETTEH